MLARGLTQLRRAFGLWVRSSTVTSHEEDADEVGTTPSYFPLACAEF